jgi:hypothetical protein
MFNPTHRRRPERSCLDLFWHHDHDGVCRGLLVGDRFHVSIIAVYTILSKNIAGLHHQEEFTTGSPSLPLEAARDISAI